jgi:hypothetical protein
MPLDYLAVSCQLASLRRRLIRLMYQKPAVNSPKLSASAVAAAVSSLRKWYNDMPSHLRQYDRVASFHERSVAVLHLRYWSAIIFATRPFLLYKVFNERSLAGSSKRKWFYEFSVNCVEAAQRSMDIIKFLRERNLLTSLIVFDCGCILENMQVFLLALSDSEPSTHTASVEACLRTLQGMEQIFWTKHALPEVTAQLEEYGILDNQHRVDISGSQSVFLDFNTQNES